MSLVDDLLRQFQSDDGESEKRVPDALELIRDDHEEVAALFKAALDDSASSAAKRTAITRVCFALTVHAKMEEKLFYPALRKAGKQKEKDSVLEAVEEHACVKELIAKIKRINGRAEALEAKVTVLKELVEDHVKEEESQIFDEARKVLGKKLQALGEEMQRFKDRAGAGTGATRKKRAAAAPLKRTWTQR
jgi:hemerythrin-like domain-containing protein